MISTVVPLLEDASKSCLVGSKGVEHNGNYMVYVVDAAAFELVMHECFERAHRIFPLLGFSKEELSSIDRFYEAACNNAEVS